MSWRAGWPLLVRNVCSFGRVSYKFTNVKCKQSTPSAFFGLMRREHSEIISQLDSQPRDSNAIAECGWKRKSNQARNEE